MAEYPRVNQEMLASHVGKRVRLVGKFVRPGVAGSMVLQAADGGEVSVQTQSQWTTPVVEVIGVVNQDLSVSEHTSVPFTGPEFDLDTYNQAVKMMHHHDNRELFQAPV